MQCSFARLTDTYLLGREFPRGVGSGGGLRLAIQGLAASYEELKPQERLSPSAGPSVLRLPMVVAVWLSVRVCRADPTPAPHGNVLFSALCVQGFHAGARAV